MQFDKPLAVCHLARQTALFRGLARTLPAWLCDLVKYVARRCATMPNRCSLYAMAEKYGWRPDDVLALLRCQKAPSKRMLREIAEELEDTASNLEHVLNR